MSMIKMNFSKIAEMKQQAYRKIGYYAIASLILFILSVFVILPSSIELFILTSFWDAVCGGLFAWNVFTYRSLTILESVTEKID